MRVFWGEGGWPKQITKLILNMKVSEIFLLLTMEDSIELDEACSRKEEEEEEERGKENEVDQEEKGTDDQDI